MSEYGEGQVCLGGGEVVRWQGGERSQTQLCICANNSLACHSKAWLSSALACHCASLWVLDLALELFRHGSGTTQLGKVLCQSRQPAVGMHVGWQWVVGGGFWDGKALKATQMGPMPVHVIALYVGPMP